MAARLRCKVVSRVKPAIPEKVEGTAVKFVRAAFRENLNLRARVSAIFRIEVGGYDVQFFHRVERDCLQAHSPRCHHVHCRHVVNGDIVAAPSISVDAETAGILRYAALKLWRNAGCGPSERKNDATADVKRPAYDSDGKRRDLLRRNRVLDLRSGSLEQTWLRNNRDLLFGCTDLQSYLDGDGSATTQQRRRAMCREGSRRHFDKVSTCIQLAEQRDTRNV